LTIKDHWQNFLYVIKNWTSIFHFQKNQNIYQKGLQQIDQIVFPELYVTEPVYEPDATQLARIGTVLEEVLRPEEYFDSPMLTRQPGFVSRLD